MLLEQYLQNIGMDAKEAKVYLSGLQLGPATIQDLAKASGIKRSTVYEVVEDLKEKSLVNVTQKNKRKLFTVQEPDNLLLFLKQKENVLAQIMPDLEALKNTTAKKPAIRVFDGISGIKQIYADMIKKPGEILAMAAPRPVIAKSVLDYLRSEWIPLRLAAKVTMRRININESEDPKHDYARMEFPEKNEIIKYLPQEHYPFTVGIYIYRQKTAFVSFTEQEMVGIIIRSPEINATMKMIFEMFWGK